jgi:queuine tRNA-ribosyltransferase
MPTRVARNGRALTLSGPLNLRNAEFAEDARPIDATCDCYACRHFTRGAIRHWLKTGEIVPLTLLTIHNLYVVSDLMLRIRGSLAAGTYAQLLTEFGGSGSAAERGFGPETANARTTVAEVTP